MKKSTMLFSVWLSIMIFCASISGVFATWIYAGEPADSVQGEIELGINEFDYSPEAILPGGDNDIQVEVGQNHLWLIENIVNHVSYGLNATSKPIVRELLEDGAGVVYSNQSVSGGNLKHMLVNDSSMEDLDFAVKYETDTFYTAFTFPSKYLTSSSVGATIEAYKTDIFYENGKWIAKTSYFGSVKVARVRGGNKQIISIDVSSWIEKV